MTLKQKIIHIEFSMYYLMLKQCFTRYTKDYSIAKRYIDLAIQAIKTLTEGIECTIRCGINNT
ncbi:hypothetical protein T07_538 [Trichinella nelsoni]|uniref:Uncharacterized protein n=1 Tax=Trichinella nelsoni TaxID=6336 RepID=A0A0V0SKY0_9BILA|nr:hypothetical protein T07_538 [Trichinella nelsoni]